MLRPGASGPSQLAVPVVLLRFPRITSTGPCQRAPQVDTCSDSNLTGGRSLRGSQPFPGRARRGGAGAGALEPRGSPPGLREGAPSVAPALGTNNRPPSRHLPAPAPRPLPPGRTEGGDGRRADAAPSYMRCRAVPRQRRSSVRRPGGRTALAALRAMKHLECSCTARAHLATILSKTVLGSCPRLPTWS